MIPHSRPWITDQDLRAIADTASGSMIAQGSGVAEFEAAMGRWLNVDGSGIAVGSGSAAIQLALAGLEIGPGDEVILPTYVCRSVLEAVLSVQATPRLADVGWDWLVNPEQVERLVNFRTRAIIVPHMYGIFTDLSPFRRFEVPLVEDCAQAIAGPGQHAVTGDIVVLSFHPTKCLTTGEGGMTLSTDPDLRAKMRRIRDGSKIPARRLFSPMSDLAAALGMSQLERYERALARRRTMAERYSLAVDAACPKAVPEAVRTRSMFFRFPIQVRGGLDTFGPRFLKLGITVRRGVDELLHRLVGHADREFPVAEALFNTTLSLPIYPALSDAEHEKCLSAARTILADAHPAESGHWIPSLRSNLLDDTVSEVKPGE